MGFFLEKLSFSVPHKEGLRMGVQQHEGREKRKKRCEKKKGKT